MTPLAYRVPFLVDRSGAPFRYRLINRGDEHLAAVRVVMLGSGRMLPLSTNRLRPGASLTVAVIGERLDRSSVLVVRWFRPSGEEYLWRVCF